MGLRYPPALVSAAGKPSTVRTGSGAVDFGTGPAMPGLLLAWAPEGATPTDRVSLARGVSVGRGNRADWTIGDDRLSAVHLRVRPFGEELLVEDLGSTNGTFVDGERISTARAVASGTVIRAGRSLLVVERDLRRLEPHDSTVTEIVGRFHGPALASDVRVAAATGRHLILHGESGTGKELCARWLGRALGQGGAFVAHNCARAASADEAETTLFGVARGVFSGVEARAGLLEEAEGGVLFLDEAHTLPLRVQRSLLRFVEDAVHQRIGGLAGKPLAVRLVLGTNVPLDSPGLAPDLLTRLFPVRVPSLQERRADIPEILQHALARTARAAGLDGGALVDAVTPDHLEALCLADLAGVNVRALESLASELVARCRSLGEAPGDAVRRVFGDRLAGSPVARRAGPSGPAESHYEAHRHQIVAAFEAAGGKLGATERALEGQGLHFSRRWLAEYLRRWGLRAGRRTPRS
jgi:DNA-binding NtrC family response regulator